MPRLALVAAAALLACSAVACGGSPNAASTQLKTPEMPPDRGAKCKIAKSQSEPLIVEWPDTARGKLESASSRGLVAIRYDGCELTVLNRCRVKEGKYAWTPITRKQSRVTIRNADELHAKMPVGAFNLEAKLESAGQLNVQMTIVGRYEAPVGQVFREDLEGDCSEATHVIAGLSVGAFTFFAGADAEVGGGASVGVGPVKAGGGGKSTASRETLEKDGDETACNRSAQSDKGPPDGCGALLQIEVVPLAKGTKVAAVPVPVPVPVPAPAPLPAPPAVEPPPPEAKPQPTKPTGKKPVATKPKRCARDERLENGECVKKIASVKPPPPILPTCSSAQHLEAGRCVDDEPAPPPPPPPPLECPSGTRRDGNACVVDGRATAAPPYGDADRPAPAQPEPYAPQSAEAPNPARTLLGYGALGFGLTWLVAGGVALGAAGEAKKECDDAAKTCSPAYADKARTARTWAIIADVSLALTAVTFVGIFLVPAKTTVGVAPSSHGATLGASGSF